MSPAGFEPAVPIFFHRVRRLIGTNTPEGLIHSPIATWKFSDKERRSRLVTALPLPSEGAASLGNASSDTTPTPCLPLCGPKLAGLCFTLHHPLMTVATSGADPGSASTQSPLPPTRSVEREGCRAKLAGLTGSAPRRRRSGLVDSNHTTGRWLGVRPIHSPPDLCPFGRKRFRVAGYAGLDPPLPRFTGDVHYTPFTG